MAGPRSINIVSVFFWLLLAGAVYFSVQYVPILWKKTELESLVKENAYGGNRKTEDGIKSSIVDGAQRTLDIAIDPEDIFVTKEKDRVMLKVIWRVTIDHPLNYVTKHNFVIRQETMFY